MKKKFSLLSPSSLSLFRLKKSFSLLSLPSLSPPSLSHLSLSSVRSTTVKSSSVAASHSNHVAASEHFSGTWEYANDVVADFISESQNLEEPESHGGFEWNPFRRHGELLRFLAVLRSRNGPHKAQTCCDEDAEEDAGNPEVSSYTWQPVRREVVDEPIGIGGLEEMGEGLLERIVGVFEEGDLV